VGVSVLVSVVKPVSEPVLMIEAVSIVVSEQ
jgi:hypothetical protein